jgi:uncharacterized protein (TIRG00374 family)
VSELREPAASAARIRQIVTVALKVTISAGLLGILWTRVDTSRLLRILVHASIPWLGVALVLYFLMVAASAWRWSLLLRAQHVMVSRATLLRSFLVATFFNNFLPSNIGGDVVRVRDTAGATGSRTHAATIVLLDRGIGLLGLVLVAAIGASATAGLVASASPIGPMLLWAMLILGAAVSARAILAPSGVSRVLQPLRMIHREWVDERIERVTGVLGRFRYQPGALAGCFVGAVAVQLILVGFYVAIARALSVPVGFWDLAVIVPVSFLVQMAPISVNGFGVREAVFGFSFARLGLPLESALTVSLVGAGLVMLFSISGAVVYVGRQS